MDILWINGENFKNAKEAGLLFGPFTKTLPNFNAYVNPSSAASDAGVPVEGYEAPYGKAQFVFEYESKNIPTPPRTFIELLDWAEKKSRTVYISQTT